ncbi:MAG: hypothetical protein K2W82_12180 [Candidatus Obscuribacterales bacterium]|nr:hypothetical protein [Candidatus Obscuribacterales bacterium]
MLHSRTASGQGLIEGTVSLAMITAMVVAGTLLIIGTGLAVYYKSKIAYAAGVGAKYGAQGKRWLGAVRPGYTNDRLTADVTNAVNAALIGLGMPAARQGRITATETTINNVSGLQVSVQEDGLEIISGGLLPPVISLTETAFYAYDNDKPLGVLGLTIGASGPVAGAPNGLGQGLYIPVYGAGSYTGGQNLSSYPSGQFPYWAAGIIRDYNGTIVSQMANGGNPYDTGQHNGTIDNADPARYH